MLITDGRANVPLEVSYNPQGGFLLHQKSISQKEKMDIREANKEEVRTVLFFSRTLI